MPSAVLALKVEDALRLVPDAERDLPELAAQLRLPGSLTDVFNQVGDLDAADKAFLEAMPWTLMETIRQGLVACVELHRPVHVAFQPGYDHAVTFTDTGEYLSILVAAPYAPGEHPHERT